MQADAKKQARAQKKKALEDAAAEGDEEQDAKAKEKMARDAARIKEIAESAANGGLGGPSASLNVKFTSAKQKNMS